jgi:radical SAM protein with 4Fe4S-binding SPASM domain
MKLRAPLYAQIEITYVCNEHCKHCLNNPRYSVSNGKPEMVDIKKEQLFLPMYRKIAKRVAEWEVFTATITGGEPLALPDRCFAVLDALVEENIYTDMNTNLTLTNSDLMKELLSRGLQGILTSVISYKPEVHNGVVGLNGALEKTIEGIRTVKEIKPNFNVCANMVLRKDNFNDVYETGVFLSKIGANAMTVCPLTPSRTGLEAQLPDVLNEQEMLQALHDLVRVNEETRMPVRILQGLPHCFLYQEPKFERFLEVGCDAGSGYVTINPYGDVMPCAQIPDKHGNILRDDLNQIWKNLNGYQNEEFLPEECKTCEAKEICGGGCRAEAERRTQTTLKAKHPFMKEPIKKAKIIENPNIDEYVGKSFRADDKLTLREESPGCYLVRGAYKDYVLLSDVEIDVLKDAQEKPFTITSELAKRSAFSNFFHQAVKSRILVEV